MAKKKKKFNIMNHKLVPKHELLSEEDVQELLEKYRVRITQLPQISSRDPVVKEIGAKKGDILKITRESPTSGRTIAYRYVV